MPSPSFAFSSYLKQTSLSCPIKKVIIYLVQLILNFFYIHIILVNIRSCVIAAHICVKVAFVGCGTVVFEVVPRHSSTPVMRLYKELCSGISLIGCQSLRGLLSMLCHTTSTRPLMSDLSVGVSSYSSSSN